MVESKVVVSPWQDHKDAERIRKTDQATAEFMASAERQDVIFLRLRGQPARYAHCWERRPLLCRLGIHFPNRLAEAGTRIECARCGISRGTLVTYHRAG